MYIFNCFSKSRNTLQTTKSDKNIVTEGLFFVPAARISQSDVYLVSIFNIFRFHSSQFCDTAWIIVYTYRHGLVSCPKFYVVKRLGSPYKHAQILPKSFFTFTSGWTIQGVSWLVDITARGDFLGPCDKKSSYKHMSDFGRLRSYGHF